MIEMLQRSEYVFFGNSLQAYLLALGIFIVLTLVFRFLQWGILKRLESLAKKTETDIDDTLIRIIRSVKPAFYYMLSVYFALQYLSFTTTIDRVIDGLIFVVIAYQVVTALHVLIDYTLEKWAKREGKDGQKAYRFLGSAVKWGLWIIAILAVISNLGINITSLVAGLGIGGIAIALAMQNILSDLFSSFAIYFDKPFEVGDFVIVGEHSGTVEKIGIKTTRLRALQGEEIVISNQELTSARIQNLKKMTERRAVFSFGILYETDLPKIKAVPDMVRAIFAGLEVGNARLDRVHLKALASSALDYEVVYYIPTREYIDYVDLQEELNIKLLESFKKEKIEFAYPTQTVHLLK
ncbi:MAG: mechanosensitive ion channel family protein [Candidatus Paceibacterota bacterium]